MREQNNANFGRCFSCQHVFLGGDMKMFGPFQICIDCEETLHTCIHCARELPSEYGCRCIIEETCEEGFICLDCAGNYGIDINNL